MNKQVASKVDRDRFGSTKFSSLRPGNIVSITTIYKESKSYSSIWEVISVAGTKIAVKEIEHGKQFEVDIATNEYAWPINFEPSQFGYPKLSEQKQFVVGATKLISIERWQESPAWKEGPGKLYEELTRSNPHVDYSDLTEFQFERTHTGYEVLRACDNAVLFKAKFSKTMNEWIGLQNIHELQNVYSDKLPNEKLDLSEFIALRIRKQQFERRQIDRFGDEGYQIRNLDGYYQYVLRDGTMEKIQPINLPLY
ncbi:hypothetical protein DYBT9623_00665 [Dyadobacter sp. CECT 9623]|uniref:Uncharacterized protein n=1 Tax=Dyadobacter linearis TaxID=2823330 RepID=A0ABM8UKN6_9BACT|nr:hypothetical protein [Dyadobacter sp. CECT 9623]CAG5067937.1 hypothetical protein DYBT9623_00665 [Dyadobacter sp. CECT 9623]